MNDRGERSSAASRRGFGRLLPVAVCVAALAAGVHLAAAADEVEPAG